MQGYHPEPAGFAAPGPIKHPRDHVQLQLEQESMLPIQSVKKKPIQFL